MLLREDYCSKTSEESAKMGFIKVTNTKELSSGKNVSFEAGGKKILVVNLEGKYYAIGNLCTHMGCMLSGGLLSGEVVECPCHGSRFDVKNGRLLKGPAKKPEPVFQVKVEGDEILVDV